MADRGSFNTGVIVGGEIVGVHEDRNEWLAASRIIIILVIAAILIGIVLIIYDIIIVNYVRTDQAYKVTRGMAVAATWVNYLGGIFIGITLVAVVIYASYVGFPKYRHNPRGYTLSEHHQLMQGYMDTKAANLPPQIDVDRYTTDLREDSFISRLGGAPNVGIDRPDQYAGLPSLDGPAISQPRQPYGSSRPTIYEPTAAIPPQSQNLNVSESQKVSQRSVIYDPTTNTFRTASPGVRDVRDSLAQPLGISRPIIPDTSIMGEPSILETIEGRQLSQ